MQNIKKVRRFWRAYSLKRCFSCDNLLFYEGARAVVVVASIIFYSNPLRLEHTVISSAPIHCQSVNNLDVSRG